jgi:hypothetical protein
MGSELPALEVIVLLDLQHRLPARMGSTTMASASLQLPVGVPTALQVSTAKEESDEEAAALDITATLAPLLQVRVPQPSNARSRQLKQC